MEQPNPNAKSPFFIIGILVLVLSLVWIGGDITPIYEYENYKLGSGNQTKGKLINSKMSGYYKKGYKSVREYEYEFYTKTNEYMVSMSYGNLTGKKAGDTVSVEYLPENPDLNRIIGTEHLLATRPGATDYLTFLAGIALLIVGFFLPKRTG